MKNPFTTNSGRTKLVFGSVAVIIIGQIIALSTVFGVYGCANQLDCGHLGKDEMTIRIVMMTTVLAVAVMMVCLIALLIDKIRNRKG